MMSADDDNSEAETADICCASCGIAEVDDVKLKECDGCDLVRYCSDACQQEHRSQHEAKCKERAAELREELLFRQPKSSHLGDCPICCLPISIDVRKSRMQTCCSKYICDGCAYANNLHQLQERMERTCLFCRHPIPYTEEESTENLMKRVAAKDSFAMSQMGGKQFDAGDYEGAFKYWSKAAELGDADAHFNLSGMYMKGTSVEKDEKKEIYHLEEASIAGHPLARCNLGCCEGISGRSERAVKHFIIAANLGHDGSIQTLKDYYKEGDISKDCFAAALRAHHAAVKATKSPQRDAAAKYFSAKGSK